MPKIPSLAMGPAMGSIDNTVDMATSLLYGVNAAGNMLAQGYMNSSVREQSLRKSYDQRAG